MSNESKAKRKNNAHSPGGNQWAAVPVAVQQNWLGN